MSNGVVGKELLDERVVAIEAVVASSKDGGVQGGSFPLSSSMGKLRAPLRFSRLSRFSCLSSVRDGRWLAPALDLDMRTPRPLLDGDDRRELLFLKTTVVQNLKNLSA